MDALMRARNPITLADKVAFLRKPTSYPRRVRSVRVIETHFAWVFLTPKHAYKLKKPMRQPAMDYRSLGARRRGCLDEVRLNRRLAPKAYLAVVPLKSRNGLLRLGGAGRIEDWLVKMSRLNASKMLDRTLRNRSLRSEETDRIVAHLVKFFARADSAPVRGDRYVRRLRREVLLNRRALERVGSRVRQSLVRTVAREQNTFLGRAARLLGRRGARVVEGDGDLRAEHVSLGPPVRVIDCLEFNRKLRLFDPAEELAFLALEIERLGNPALAAELLRRFEVARGDPVPEAIFHFYLSHRAATRAKLAVWHLGDPQFSDTRPWIARAHSYLRDAQRHGGQALRLLREPMLSVANNVPSSERRSRSA